MNNVNSEDKMVNAYGAKLHYGKIKIPENKKVAVAVTVDFDGVSGWDGTANLSSMAYLERGRFGAEFGVPRLLDTLKQNNIKSTWFIPGHTLCTFKEPCRMIAEAGHEMGIHGYNHENITHMTYAQEADIMARSLDAFRSCGYKKPISYRSPAWDYSPNTLQILLKNGFKYDSSLMASDIYPFYNQNITHKSNSFDTYSLPSSILTFPPSWFMDDFIETEFSLKLLNGLKPVEDILNRWKQLYDFASQYQGSCYVLTVHPQSIGRGHMLTMFQDLLTYLRENGAWFATIEEMGNLFISDTTE